MMDIELYEKIYKKMYKNYDFANIQLVTSDLGLIGLLIYIQNKIIDKFNLNVFYIRKNRVKSGTYSKIEGKINEKKILVIESKLSGTSNLEYIEKSLELLNKKIDYIFATEDIIENKINNISITKIGTTKLIFSPKNQNLQNLYKKNFIQTSGGKLLFLDDLGALFCFDRYYKQIWKTIIHNEDKISFKPIIVGNYVYIINNSGDLFKILLENGLIIEKKSICDTVLNNMYYSNRKIYIFGVNSSINNKFSLYIVDIDSLFFDEKKLGTKICSEALFFDNKIFFGNENNELIIYDFIDIVAIKLDGNILGGFEYSDKCIYFATDSGTVYKYDILNNKNSLENKISNFWILTKPLLVKENIYVTCVDKKMYILDLSLNVVGIVNTTGRNFGNPILIKENLVCFGSNDSRLYVYNIDTKQRYYYQFSERIIAEPVLFNNKLVVQDFLNNIYELNLPI